jgi:hypothetical protein
MVKSVVYGREAWPMTEMDMKILNTWERKILYIWISGRTRNVDNKN